MGLESARASGGRGAVGSAAGGSRTAGGSRGGDRSGACRELSVGALFSRKRASFDIGDQVFPDTREVAIETENHDTTLHLVKWARTSS